MELRILHSAPICAAMAVLIVLSTSAMELRAQTVNANAAPTTNAPPAQSFTAQPNGANIKMPTTRPASRTSGATMHFDSRWANNYGYRPILITINTPKPTTSDRTIRVRLYAKAWDRRLGRMQVEQVFQLPAGAATASTNISLPQVSQYQWIGGQQIGWEVWVNGVRDRDLSNDWSTGLAALGVGGATETGLSIMAVGPANASRQSLISNSFDYELITLTAADLPTRWLDYTCFDIVALSVNDLRSLAATKQEALTAIRRWVRAGGQLWISDAGPAWERLAGIEQLLQLDGPPSTPGDADERAQTDEQVQRLGWTSISTRTEDWDGRVVTFADYSTGNQRVVRDPKVIARFQRSGRYYIVSESTETTNRRENADSGRWFFDRPLGVGNLRAFRGQELQAMWDRSGISATTWAASQNRAGNVVVSTPPNAAANKATAPPALSAALENTLDWRTRHGLAPDEANPEFTKWLVPGVGLAPVTAFRVLITLFVLLIGPVNYLLLKRYQRLHLLVITVPLAAVLLTAALFAYALVSDGLHTTVRARSFTILDQRAGEAATWARLSYYAGLAPGQGLTMSGDTAVYPIIPAWNGGMTNSELQVAREIVWDGDQARLTRGWLRSRTPTQYLTVRASASSARLQMQFSGDKMQTKNELGAAIQYIAVVDPAGKLFAGENIAIDAAAELLPVDRNDVARQFRELTTHHTPQLPPELADMQRLNDWTAVSPNVYMGRYAITYDALLSENLMNQELERWTDFNEDPVPDWRRRTYVAVTATGPEVELGVEVAREEASFHVVVGKW